ncbi:MAG TPA: hypothetical protein VK968_19620 [Roseimicrobium sp.]|nr:hypothetical protein [Roseimicrobium sp.]
MTRYLSIPLAVISLLVWSGENANAQLPPPNSAVPVTFSTLALGRSISDLFYEDQGKPRPLQAQTGGLSQPYQRPKNGKLSIFRLAPPTPPATDPTRVPVASALLGNEGPYLVLLTTAGEDEAQPGSVTAEVLDDSWATHPLRTFRVINFSKRTTAVQLANANQVIPSRQAHVFPLQGEAYDFDFKVAALENDGWILRVVSPQSIIPRTRATVIIADPIPTPLDPHPVDLNVFTFYDSSQPPKP